MKFCSIPRFWSKERPKRARPSPILKFKLNRQPYVEVACGRQQPPPGSVWAAGLMDVLGDRWNGVSGALGASNGSYGPLDVHNCNKGVGNNIGV